MPDNHRRGTPRATNKRPIRRLAAVAAGLLIAAFVGLTYYDYQREIQPARERINTGSEIAQTACGPIEYAVAGEGPPVLVVHGAGGGFDQGIGFSTPLVERGFRVIAMSRFGYLRTPLPTDASAAAQADAHACLLDALDIKRAAIIGASAGAPSSMQFALRHPQRITALVLMVPAAYMPRPDNAPPVKTPAATQVLFDTALRSDFLFWSATRFARRTLIASILATPPAVVDNATPQEQQRVQQVLQHILPISPRRTGLVNDAAVITTLPRYDLERIRAPTLAISTEDDRFGTYDNARYTAEHIKGARFVGYPSGGHLWVGHQHDVMLEITQFLKQPRRVTKK
jgi:2-hydroxy-6-oxonona-2,4-dienedioate hydrolase